jgi:uncharacterized membrane protein YfcA
VTDLSLTTAAVAGLVVGLASVVQGSVGFGLALLAAPFLVLLDPRLVPGPLLLTSTMLTVLCSIRDRDAVDVRGVGYAMAGRLPGVVVGAWILTRVAAADLGLLFGILIVLGALMMGFGPPIQPRVPALLGAGFVSGVMGTSSSIGGPPMALLYQHEPGARMRGTLAGYFTLGALLSLIALAASGRFGRWEIQAALWLMPGVFIGFAASSRTARWLDAGRTRLAVLWTAGLAGALLVLLYFLR